MNHSLNKADSKLCTMETLSLPNSKGGQFISILPRNRQEVKTFHEKLTKGEVVWKNTLEVPNSRKLHCKIVYLTHPGETTREGYPILWVHSSAKAISDNHQRQKKVNASDESSVSDKIESIVFTGRAPMSKSASTRQQSCLQTSVNSLYASSAR
jgi:hypothetical protein